MDTTTPSTPATQSTTAGTSLNGWNLEQVGPAFAELAAHPERGALTWRSRVRWDGGFAADATPDTVEVELEDHNDMAAFLGLRDDVRPGLQEVAVRVAVENVRRRRRPRRARRRRPGALRHLRHAAQPRRHPARGAPRRAGGEGGAGMIKRTLMTGYGLLAYAAFLVVFLYALGFVEGLVVPKAINDGTVTDPAWVGLLIDVGLLGLFAVQHSVMARPAFKRWWTQFLPRPIERTTYVALSSGVLALLLWQWRPFADVLWEVGEPWRTVLYAVSLGGWAVVLISTFLIDHFDLFGLRQVVRQQRGLPQVSPTFRTPLFYRLVRHPLMLGFVIAFWAAPTMTTGRLLFDLATTGYILVALRLEERDLVTHFGERYLRYREEVPMLVPGIRPLASRRGRAEVPSHTCGQPLPPASTTRPISHHPARSTVSSRHPPERRR